MHWQVFLLLHLVSSGTLRQLEIPKKPHSHSWQLVPATGFWPGPSILLLTGLSMSLLGLPMVWSSQSSWNFYEAATFLKNLKSKTRSQNWHRVTFSKFCLLKLIAELVQIHGRKLHKGMNIGRHSSLQATKVTAYSVHTQFWIIILYII